MEQDDEFQGPRADRSASGESQAEAVPSERTFSPGRIRDVFLETGGLTTIEVRKTILVEPIDTTNGAERFRELFMTLHGDAKLSGVTNPEFVWAATNSKPLIQVVQPLAGDNHELYLWILKHAIFADLSTAPEVVLSIKQKLVRPNPDQPLALTTGRSTVDGSSLFYDAHFRPSTSSDVWPEGPLCETLSSLGVWLDDIVRDLYKCHGDVLKKRKGIEKDEAVQRLNKIGISVFPLEKFFDTV